MPHWVRGFSGSQFPVFNIFLPRTPLGLTDEILADTEAFFSSRNAMYAIELIHDRLPEGPDFLNQRNYQALPPQPAMFLTAVPNGIPLNTEAQLERVATVPALTAFCTLLQAVFDFPQRDLIKIFPVAQLKDSKISHYLAFINEEPVGAGTIVCAEGMASIWNMCTLDSHRRQGIATTLMHHMLKEAEQRDCHSATLYSTAQAYNFYSKFGFEIYTQRQWFLPPGIDYDEDED
jgi:ribosomal protein S18 acetylase RimI-like enzyme